MSTFYVRSHYVQNLNYNFNLFSPIGNFPPNGLRTRNKNSRRWSRDRRDLSEHWRDWWFLGTNEKHISVDCQFYMRGPHFESGAKRSFTEG